MSEYGWKIPQWTVMNIAGLWIWFGIVSQGFEYACSSKYGRAWNKASLWIFKAHRVLTLHKKWSFPMRISPVNVTKSAENCGFGHIYWRNP